VRLAKRDKQPDQPPHTKETKHQPIGVIQSLIAVSYEKPARKQAERLDEPDEEQVGLRFSQAVDLVVNLGLVFIAHQIPMVAPMNNQSRQTATKTRRVFLSMKFLEVGVGCDQFEVFSDMLTTLEILST